MPIPIPSNPEEYINVFDYCVANCGMELDEQTVQEKRSGLLSYLQILGVSLYYACLATQGVINSLGLPFDLGCTPPPQ